MLRKLRLDSLDAELATVKKLFQEANENGDPVGKVQYKYRINSIESEIEILGRDVPTTASVALFFGGKPVLGSRGISTSFAGNILENFQDLISKVYASYEYGDLGTRGKIPLKGNTQLMISELARGSFGFVLEELTDQEEIADTPLKNVVSEVAVIIEKTTSENEKLFEEVVDMLDERAFMSLRNFFSNLDNSDATIRLVEESNEYSLKKSEIHLGRIRTESTTIKDDTSEMEGRLIGFLPEHKKFELQLDNGDYAYGSVTKEASEQYKTMLSDGEEFINKKWLLNVDIRIISEINRNPRKLFKILKFLKRLD